MLKTTKWFLRFLRFSGINFQVADIVNHSAFLISGAFPYFWVHCIAAAFFVQVNAELKAKSNYEKSNFKLSNTVYIGIWQHLPALSFGEIQNETFQSLTMFQLEIGCHNFTFIRTRKWHSPKRNLYSKKSSFYFSRIKDILGICANPLPSASSLPSITSSTDFASHCLSWACCWYCWKTTENHSVLTMY